MSKFSQLLLNWYDENARDLPWRRVKNPYYIWISEIMLQQTQVVTVIPYFLRFIAEFPTVEALANSDENRLMKVWEGLGYYSRARNLRFAAKQIIDDYHGKMPNNRAELLNLKGVGPYTASAIASIAFNEVTPAIDGNAFRVFARLMMESADIGEAKSRPLFEKIGYDLIEKKRAGDFNQAIMDLGSQICTPKQPQCQQCPVELVCLSFHKAIPTDFPKKAKKIKKKDIYLIADWLVNEQNELLFEKRGDSGVLKGMWLFPIREVNHQEYLAMEAKALGKVKHVFTHLNWHLLVIPAENKIAESTNSNRRWLKMTDLDKFPIPKVQYKLLQTLPKRFLRDM